MIRESPRQESIKFKSGNAFSQVLKEYIRMFENELIVFDDIKAAGMVFVTKEEIEDLFREFIPAHGHSTKIISYRNGSHDQNQ